MLQLLAAVAAVASGSGVGRWAWMGGSPRECTDNTTTPGSVCSNTPTQPSARCCSHVFFDDATGLAYVWGGYGFDATGQLAYLSDLWAFNGTAAAALAEASGREIGLRGEEASPWRHVSGPLTGNARSSGEQPAARCYGAYAWDAATRAFTVFSGEGPDKALDDVWTLDAGTLRWARRDNSHAGIGSSGGSQAAASAPRPPARWWSNFWALDDNLYVQSGTTGDGDNVMGDMWVWRGSSREWRRLADRGVNANASYGGPEATPGARVNAFTASDGKSLWLFGGEGFNDAGVPGVLSDLWRFDPASERWSFAGGSRGGIEVNGTCGPRGVRGRSTPTARHAGANFDFVKRNGVMLLAAGEHHPGIPLADARARRGGRGHGVGRSAVTSRDEPGLLKFNDLWSVDVVTGEWAFEGGDCNVNNVLEPTHGPRGVPALSNAPQGRYGPNGWTDRDGAAWVFGGGFSGYNNDVWRFTW